MNWFFYAVALPIALLFLASAGCALHWAFKHGQTRALWVSVRSLFGETRGERPDGPGDQTRSDSRGASQQT